MSTKKLPRLEFITIDCGGIIDYDNRPLPDKHKTVTPISENPFSFDNKYRITLYLDGRVFANNYHYGPDLHRLANELGDEVVVLTHLLKGAANKKGESGRYEAAVSVVANHREYDLAIPQPDGTMLEKVSITV
jgi:hypothetical protein